MPDVALTRPFVFALTVLTPLSLSGCVLLNDYGGFTIGDRDAGGPDGRADASASETDASRESDAGNEVDCTSPGTIYVSEAGDDTNDGTIDAPLRSVAAAMAAARRDASIVNVHLSAGTYETVYESESEIVLVDGVTLRGGYRDDFCTYDPRTYVTTIAERFTGGGHIDPMESPIVAIRGDDLPNGVVLEGLRVSIGNETDDNHVGIRLRNTSAVLRDVVVAGGDGRSVTGIYIAGAAALTMERVTVALDDTSHESTGVHLVDVHKASLREMIVERTRSEGLLSTFGILAEYNSAADGYELEISRSRIHGGRGETSTRAIKIAHAEPTSTAVTVNIVNNLIHGGELASTTAGIELTVNPRNVSIYNNTIFTGEGENFAYGITYQYSYTAPDIRNNIIFSTGHNQFCIYQWGGAWSGDGTMSNNLFFDCPLFLFYDGGPSQISDIAALNMLRNSTANQKADSVPLVSLTGPDLLTGTMANNDWSFAEGAPCTYTDGAFPAEEITVDYFGNPRDATPSIGAIEFTGTSCTP